MCKRWEEEDVHEKEEGKGGEAGMRVRVREVQICCWPSWTFLEFS